MNVDRDRVRALVRAELETRLRGAEPRPRETSAAFLEIYQSTACSEDLDYPIRRPCVIEPHLPCTNSGYCKKLGH